MSLPLTAVLAGFTAFSSAQPENIDQLNGPQRQAFTFERQAVVTFSAIDRDLAPTLHIQEMPGPDRVKKTLAPPEAGATGRVQKIDPTLQPLRLGSSSFGNGFNNFVPNDNDLAISDSGYIISVINCQVLMRNIKTNLNTVKSLAGFTMPVNNDHKEFDPKVIYDPENDRFILVCLSGSRDSTSKAIIAFSQSSDPTGAWNMYLLPGNPKNNNLWSDYPMIAGTKKELFFTVNLLYEDSTWQAGFVETLIWQMSKDSGYAGKNLATYLHSNIKHNNRPLRNICPVKGGSRSYGPEMYFLSNRNFSAQNDTVFLITLSDTLGSSSHSLGIKALKSSQPYYFPADAWQPLATQSLATNDARNLGAFYENGRIQFVHNTNNPANGRASVYYGVIYDPASSTPTATGYILPNDSLDYGYPNISYAGLDSADHTAILCFNHSSKKIFAGCSAVESDGNGEFSPVLRIRNGTSYVDLFGSLQVERWGDYTGSQRRYSKPGEVWMSGFVGSLLANLHAHRTWIAQVTTYKSETVGYKELPESGPEATIFPNPGYDMFTVKLTISKAEQLNFNLYDGQGKLVDVLMREWARPGELMFSFRTNDLPRGVYVLAIRGITTNVTEKVIIN
jgi:hypothetical protein